MNVAEFVEKHTVRGSCQCGACFDAPLESEVPKGHTVSVEFFDVGQRDVDDKSADEFMQLVAKEFPHWLNGNEHSYLETGADIGDQGLAMQAMALGDILGVWELLTPTKLLGSGPEMADLRKQMAGSGYISIVKAAA